MEKSYQKRWYCVAEDAYLNEDFFNVVNETGSEHVEIMHLGNTSHFIIDIFSFLKKDATISLVLSDIEDDVLSDGFNPDDLDKEVFQRYQDLYEPYYFYFFDADRLHDDFFPLGRSEAKCHEKKLLELNQYASENMFEHFFLVPSFPSLTSFAWQISSYTQTNTVDVVNVTLQSCTSCKGYTTIHQRQRLHKEQCVICKLRDIEMNSFICKGGKQKDFRGYGVKEKQFFSSSKKHYRYLEFLLDTKKWDGFYRFIYRTTLGPETGFLSLENLRISEELIKKLATIKIWFSTIPLVIENSRKGWSNSNE